MQGFFGKLFELDVFFLDKIQAVRTPFLDKTMLFFTAIGDEGIFWITFSVILMCFSQTRRAGILMFLALLLTYLFSTLGLKMLFERQRPCERFQALFIYPCPLGYSFPSGHSISSFSAAGVLFFFYKKRAFLALILAFLIAFSRLYLYVHFPSDVIVGGALGFLTAFLLVRYEAKKRPVL